MSSGSDQSLPLIGAEPRERCDAARNRRKILTAAERLVADRGVDALTMSEVAAAAGVGVGTVYRRFRDTGAIVYALIDEQERELQRGMISGPPPLGPGAPPLQRIRAFLHAYVDLLDRGPMLIASAERASGNRYAVGAYGFHRAHLVRLIREARPDTNAGFLADAMLGALDARLYLHQRTDLGMTPTDIKTGLDELLAGFESSA